VTVTVKLFASFRAGRFDAKTADYPAGTTVGDVVDSLALPRADVGVIMINSRHASSTVRSPKGTTWRCFRCWAAVDMDSLKDFFEEHADGDLLPWHRQLEASRRFGLTIAETEEAILAHGLLPARYQRNRTTIPQAGQRELFHSQVAVVGCGGLGGYVIEELARLGVGRIVAIDPDVFEEHNLNRQLLSTPERLGTSKVAAAARRVGEVNPAVTLVPLRRAFSRDNGGELLAGCRVAVDCLDAIASRLELADACSSVGIPLVHGAIAGWYGQLTTQFPARLRCRPSTAPGAVARGSKRHWETPPSRPRWWPAWRWPRSASCCWGRGRRCGDAS